MMVAWYQVKRLGGWTRLWVVASVIWIAGCALITVLDWPERENYSLASAVPWERDAMAPPVESWQDAAEGDVPAVWNYKVTAPDGHTYQIHGPEAATDEQVRSEVLRQHPDAGHSPRPQYNDVAYSEEKSRQIWLFALVAFIPPALLAALMFAVGWIRRGFSG